ncbi:MAG: protein phosphatase 2C domain-containing protein [Verrucomicrobiota bacterium]|nr:protein phosphatase 2C domain-containing protein [Verrucomicrobiota bacterium]
MSENASQDSGFRLNLSWHGRTDVGRFRKNNEDAFLALTFDACEVRYLGKDGSAPMDGEDFIFAVSDGMGGAKAGEFASKIAVDKITDLLPKTFSLAAMGIDRGCAQILGELFSRIHSEMVTMGIHYEECRGMGATLSLCWFNPDRMYFAHVGDSRIYYLPKNEEMQQLTHDHTHVGQLVRQGKITEFEAKMRPDRNILNQALGGNIQKLDPQIGSVDYLPGDRFALCTDGVTDGISNRRIHTLIDSPPSNLAELSPVERIIKDSIDESGRDNLTAITIEVKSRSTT